MSNPKITDSTGIPFTLSGALDGSGNFIAYHSFLVNGTPVASGNPMPVTLPAGFATAALQPALNADGGGLAHVTNFPASQVITAAALPLPTGAATAALQPAINGDGGGLAHVTNFPATQAVSVAALPALPAGSNLIGAVGLGLTQQAMNTPALGSSVSVPANTATAIWTYNSAAKSLAITYATTGTAVISTSDGSASWLAAGGYVWNPGGDQVPNKSLTLTCTQAVTVYVAEGH